MIVSRILRWTPLRTLACLACVGGVAPATARAGQNDPVDSATACHSHATTVIGASSLGAGIALMLVSGFVRDRQEVVTGVHYYPDDDRITTTTAEDGNDTSGLLLAGLACVFLGAAMLINGPDRTSVADGETARETTDASGLKIQSVRLNGQPATGLALAF